MSSNVVNQSPFLRTSRDFPQEAQPLSVETTRSYIDIANKMNSRSIGIYPADRPAQGGDTWTVTAGKSQQSFRQVYPFTAVGSIPHNINFNSVSFISPNSYGTYTNGTNWFGVIYGNSAAAIVGQLSFYVTSSNIVIVAGAGAVGVSQGYIHLEWASKV